MVQVVNRALDILELVGKREGHSISLTEIASELELKQSTAANIIKTLVVRDYLEHIGAKKGYKLGLGINKLNHEFNYEQELVEAAKSVMEELTSKLQESSVLGIFRNYKRYALFAVNSNQEIQVKVSSERNIYETASGRVLLAFQDPKEIGKYISLNGLPTYDLWPEASTYDNFMQEIKKIKDAKLATTFLKDRFVRGFASPIFRNGRIIAGLSVFLPDFRCSDSTKKEIIDLLKKASIEITTKLSDATKMEQ